MKRTQLQCRHCVNLIKIRLTGNTIGQEQNKEVASGYKAAIDIIKNRILNERKS